MHDPNTDFEQWANYVQADAPAFFDTSANAAKIHVARAPGRLDVMGGIADYSGSLVAEMPLAQAAVVGAQAGGTSEAQVIVHSANAQAENLAPEVVLPAHLFVNPVSLLRFVRDSPHEAQWAGYAAGCFALLRAEGLVPKNIGARLLVRSTVPLGAGVSSSAAIEVASMRALCSAFGVPMDGLTLARLCQRVENDVMDAPCGVMDQVTSALGQAGNLLALLCQPYQIQESVPVPLNAACFGIDSQIKHSVAGAAYGRVRVGAFMGYKILADRAKNGFGGYLCNLSPDEYRALLPERLPETMHGAEFLSSHSGIFDTVTTVNPAETYPVRASTEHAINEMQRVRAFLAAFQTGTPDALADAGTLMGQSHQSYSACGLGSPETDFLVRLALDAGAYGAKITGGGSGGTVCVLCPEEKQDEIAQTVCAAYHAETGKGGRIISGSSPGAMHTPVRDNLI